MRHENVKPIRRASVCLAALFVAACTSVPPTAAPTPTSPAVSAAPASASPIASPAGSPVISSVEAAVPEGNLRLTLISARPSYAANEPIDVNAELAYLGPQASVNVAGSGDGLLFFSLKQLDGHLEMGYGATDDCRPYRLEQAKPLTTPYLKSGGFGNGDADAPFWRQFFADPVFRLPAGQWQVTVLATYVGPGCTLPTRTTTTSITLDIR